MAGIPFVGYAEKHTQSGALFSASPDYEDIGAQAGELVNRILGGERPSALGILPARTALLSINRNVARTLGISLSAEVEQRAVRIIE